MGFPKVCAVVGCGRYVEGKEGWAIGHAHGSAYRTAFPDCQLWAVDPNAENLSAFAERFGVLPEHRFTSLGAMIEAGKPDMASVCTWPGLHVSQGIALANAGVCALVVEKPVALDAGTATELAAACRESGTKLAVAHQRRYLPVFERLRQLVASGEIGSPCVLEARVGDGWDVLSWTTHWFDLAAFGLGARPLRVLAGADVAGERRYGHAVESASVVWSEFEGGHQGVFITGPDAVLSSPILVTGPEGQIRASEDGLEIYSKQGYRTEGPFKPCDAFARLVLDVWTSVESGVESRCSATNCLPATRLAYAAHDSARTARTVDLDQTPWFAPLEVMARPAKPLLPDGDIVLMADEHFGSGGREGIAEAVIAEFGRSPRLVDAVHGLNANDLEGAGLLLLYHTQSEADKTTRACLRNWIESGRPTLFVHAALGAYPGWDEYALWAGRVWDWQASYHPYEECVLVSNAEGAQILGWQTGWLPKDEVFCGLKKTGDLVDLMHAHISDGPHPAAWRHAALPNLAAWVPGHRRDSWTLPTMRNGLMGMARLVLQAGTRV